jgi:ATP-dependent protease ClpP protease subunit
MPSWNQVLEEINNSKRIDSLDFIRRKYLKLLSESTGRNIIAYYSGWLQKPGIGNADINDDDKNGLMAVIHGMNRKKGLDLILHTPGGDTAATESIVDYLRRMFGTDIRAIVPQIAMSAGTMIACACREIIMGKQSNLGPIDPQFGGIPAHGVLDEFSRALEETQSNPKTIPIWQKIVEKYHPTFLGECQNAIDLSLEMVTSWLETGMFKGNADARNISETIAAKLNDHEKTKTHSRHINIDEAVNIGLITKFLEKDFEQEFQDLVLTVHHSYMHTFSKSSAIKIVENHMQNAVVYNLNQ